MAHAAWSEVGLLPDAWLGVTDVDLSTSALRQLVGAAVALAPTGFHGLLRPGAEAATTAAYGELDLLLALSYHASVRLVWRAR